ncbi:MAG: prenyltransferase [Spirochaetota bacterium]
MTVRQFLSVVELRTKVISVSTYALATIYTASVGFRVSSLEAVLLAVAVLCVDMGTTAFNSFYDYARRVDTRRSTEERDKVLVHEGVAPGHALVVSLVLYLVAAATGIAVALLSSGWIIVAGVAGMLVGFLYNGGPVPISRTPAGELFAGGFLGTVLFLVVYGVHAGRLDAAALVASLPSTLLIAAVLTVNNTCDMEGDRSAGRRTLSIVLGRTAAATLVDGLAAAAYALLLLMSVPPVREATLGASGLPVFPPAASVVIAVGAAVSAALLVRMHARGYRRATKSANMTSIIGVVAIYTLAYAAALVLALPA